MNHEVMISCAVTGGADNKGRNPNLPITAVEIADDIAAVARAGASIVHVHARHPETTKESWEVAHFAAIVDEVRKRQVDVIINLTTAIGMLVGFDLENPSRLDPDKTQFWPPERRLEHIRAIRPEICSLDLPIMNYSDTPYCNLPQHVAYLAKELRTIGVKPEIECFTPGDLWRLAEFMEEGLFEPPPFIQLCMGVKYGMPATTRGLVAMCDLLPKGVVWSAFGIGRQQMPMVAQSVLMGGHVRVGLEDNLFIEKGVAATNVGLVERAVEIIERLGASVMPVSRAREVLAIR